MSDKKFRQIFLTKYPKLARSLENRNQAVKGKCFTSARAFLVSALSELLLRTATLDNVLTDIECFSLKLPDSMTKMRSLATRFEDTGAVSNLSALYNEALKMENN